MKRGDFQKLAEERLEDARVLLANGRFSAAFYMAGYVIECALKSCIAKLTKPEEFPIRDSNKFYIHDLEKLAKLARFDAVIEDLSKKDATFRTNWEWVRIWSEQSRYEEGPYEGLDEQIAKSMLEAVSDPDHGVLSCIKQYW